MSTKRWVLGCLLGMILVFPASMLVAQGPPGGGFGGPGGGFGGGPSSFLSRMDTNGNGVLEPDEMQGRARFFLERMTQSIPGMSLDRPIPLSRLTEAFERMRQERFGGSGPSDRGGRDDRGGSSRGGGDSSSRSGGGSGASVEPLVPGFGVEEILDPIPGFGSGAEQFAVKIIESDYREADQTLARNDRNKDGVLDQEEIRRGRWRDDPSRQDRNGDGKLSRTELALRYAMRRAEREGSSSSSGRSSGRSSSGSSGSSSRSSSSSSSDPRLESLLRSVYDRYDRNKNGVFERDEWSSFRSDPSAADTSRDGRITREEMSKWLADRYLNRGGSSDSRGGWGGSRGGWGGPSSRSGGDSRWSSFRGGGGDRDDGGGERGSGEASAGSGLKIVGKSRQGHLAYDVKTATERLPDEVPEWFRSLDANADGQVAMHEYKASWTEQDVADFAQFDLDRDGLIRAAECLAATERGAVRGSPSASLVSSTGSSSAGSGYSGSSSSGSTSTGSSTSTSGASDDRYVRYAVGFIRRYDDNGDGVLVKDEWSKMSRDYSHADADMDGKITPLELAKAMSSQ